ncbi:hypothetical protein ACFL6C_06345 [Myxococcota bacterium]
MRVGSFEFGAKVWIDQYMLSFAGASTAGLTNMNNVAVVDQTLGGLIWSGMTF